MYIQLCDRCGKQTNNNAALLLPTTKEKGSLQVNGSWFGDPITLCNDCLIDFDNFRYNHKRFNICLETEDNYIITQKS